MTTAIQCRPLSAAHHLNCPSCGTALFTAHHDSFEVPNGPTWLDDGDTLGGLFDELTPEQQTPDGFLCSLMVGTCKHCQANYYVSWANFMDLSWVDAEAYLIDDPEPERVRNYLCTHQAAGEATTEQWLLMAYHYPAGIVRQHVFGPWALPDPTGVIGNNGVSSCGDKGMVQAWRHAQRVLMWRWDALKPLCPRGE